MIEQEIDRHLALVNAMRKYNDTSKRIITRVKKYKDETILSICDENKSRIDVILNTIGSLYGDIEDAALHVRNQDELLVPFHDLKIYGCYTPDEYMLLLKKLNDLQFAGVYIQTSRLPLIFMCKEDHVEQVIRFAHEIFKIIPYYIRNGKWFTLAVPSKLYTLKQFISYVHCNRSDLIEHIVHPRIVTINGNAFMYTNGFDTRWFRSTKSTN